MSLCSAEPSPDWPPFALLCAMLNHAHQSQPAEACGAWSRSGHFWWHHPLENVLPTPINQSQYLLDPIAWLKLLEAEERGELRLLGIYHSHPHSSPTMSRTDLGQWTSHQRPLYPNLQQLILSLQTPAQCALYQWSPSRKCYHCTGTIDLPFPSLSTNCMAS